MTFPRIVSESDGVTAIALGYGMPSVRSDDDTFRPLCLIVIQVPTRSAAGVMERIRGEGAAR